MAQVIIIRPITTGACSHAFVEADRKLLTNLLNEARVLRGKGFWADEDASIVVGKQTETLSKATDIDALVAKLIP